MNCSDCKAVMAYKDLEGRLHSSEIDCAKRNETIRLKELMDDYELGYRRLWPTFFPNTEDPHYRGGRDHGVLYAFIRQISKDGYAITKV